jgi:hypothetical protein
VRQLFFCDAFDSQSFEQFLIKMTEPFAKFFTLSAPTSQKPKASPRTPGSARKRPRKATDSTQTVLDAGQSKIGLTHCSEVRNL